MDLNLWFNPSLLDKIKQKAAEARLADRPFVAKTLASSTVNPYNPYQNPTSPFSTSSYTSTSSLSNPPLSVSGAGGDFSRTSYNITENQLRQEADTKSFSTTTTFEGGYSSPLPGLSPEEPNRLITTRSAPFVYSIFFDGVTDIVEYRPGFASNTDSQYEYYYGIRSNEGGATQIQYFDETIYRKLPDQPVTGEGYGITKETKPCQILSDRIVSGRTQTDFFKFRVDEIGGPTIEYQSGSGGITVLRLASYLGEQSSLNLGPSEQVLRAYYEYAALNPYGYENKPDYISEDLSSFTLEADVLVPPRVVELDEMGYVGIGFSLVANNVPINWRLGSEMAIDFRVPITKDYFDFQPEPRIEYSIQGSSVSSIFSPGPGWAFTKPTATRLSLTVDNENKTISAHIDGMLVIHTSLELPFLEDFGFNLRFDSYRRWAVEGIAGSSAVPLFALLGFQITGEALYGDSNYEVQEL